VTAGGGLLEDGLGDMDTDIVERTRQKEREIE
jgi:hypothetical protein